MNAIVKKQKIDSLHTMIGPTPPPVSPDSPIKKQQNENSKLTKKDTTMNREMLSLAKRKETIRHPEKDSGNRLVHWDSLKELLCTNLVCKKCGADVHVSEITIGIATQVSVACKGRHCNMKGNNKVRRTSDKNKDIRPNSSASFAINCQFVLALMQTGSGSTEAGTMVSYLNLPNSSTFQSTTFYRIQESIRPAIVKLSEKSIVEAREEEVLAAVGKEKSDL